jgi:DNA segregation ATPase FtsK/SpoIIIE-like protein
MLTILLFGAALLAIYLGFRLSRQKEPQSPPENDDQPDRLQEISSNLEPAGSPSPESAERLNTISTKLPLKRSIQLLSTERDPLPDLKDYQVPTIDLLHSDASETRLGIEANPEKQKEQIIRTLRGFDIEVASITATVGPAMTLFELVPAPGVRIARIRNLEEELALALATRGCG